MFLPNIMRCLSVSRVYFRLNYLRRFCAIYDKNFDYFRNNVEYKNSVVQLNLDLDSDKSASPEFSLVFREHGIQADGVFGHLQHRENVMKLTTMQVKEILCLMANARIDTLKYAMALKYLDEKCALSVERWPLDLSFYILDAWFIIWGPKVFRKYYYSAITSQWGRRMRKCSKFNLILMLYFIGVSKSPPPFLMESIEDRMENYVSDFSDEEYAVACLSFFKTSRRLGSGVILKQSCLAAMNLLSKNDRFNVISILKCLRLSRYYDATLWGMLKDYTLKEHSSFNFVECTNFLAIFAAQNLCDLQVFECLERQGIASFGTETDFLKDDPQEVSKVHPSKRSRVKDLARFLWALSSMGYAPKQSTLSAISDEVLQRFQQEEFDQQFHVLVDILQSFILFGHYPDKILRSVLVPAILKKVLYLDRAKPKYQLYFVQRSVKIECPEIIIDKASSVFNNPIPKNLEKEIKDRKGFRDVVKLLESLSAKFKSCYLIPHIMIAGIVLDLGNKDGSKLNFELLQKYFDAGIISKQVKDVFESSANCVCLEILDSTVCAKDTTLPLGLMNTKIRQLKKLNFPVFTLTTEEISHIVELASTKNTEDLLRNPI